LYRNPGTGNAGFSEMNVRVDGYSFSHHSTSRSSGFSVSALRDVAR
jgi:hypothetical protein